VSGLIGKLLRLFDVSSFYELQDDRIVLTFPQAPPEQETLDDDREGNHRGGQQRDHNEPPFGQDANNPAVDEVS
jgi:hypothetical protein